MEAQPIPEIDVIVGVAIWLHSNGWRVERVSMPRGQGISQHSQNEKLESKFKAVGICLDDLVFASQGADIEARCGNEVWRIECKGLGNVAPSTMKNNFDRAIASAVSYYNKKEGLRIGLAVPEDYNRFIRDKLSQALREAINLWIFLYVSYSEVYVFEPREEIPL